MLDEFSGTSSTQPTDATDPGPVASDDGPWEDLGQEGIAQGFVDDIQGILEGK